MVDRDAFLERFKFFELLQQHTDKVDADFPFNAIDMARFILRVLNKTLPELPDIAEEVMEPIVRSEPPGVLMAEIVHLKLKLAEREKEIEDLKLEARVG